MDYGTRQGATKLDYATRLAACLAYLMLRSAGQRRPGDLRHEDPPLHPAARADEPPARCWSTSSQATKPGGETELGEVFHDLVPKLHRRGLLVIISDCFGDVHELLSGAGPLPPRPPRDPRSSRSGTATNWSSTSGSGRDSTAWRRDGKKYLVDPNHLRGGLPGKPREVPRRAQAGLPPPPHRPGADGDRPALRRGARAVPHPEDAADNDDKSKIENPIPQTSRSCEALSLVGVPRRALPDSSALISPADARSPSRSSSTSSTAASSRSCPGGRCTCSRRCSGRTPSG